MQLTDTSHNCAGRLLLGLNLHYYGSEEEGKEGREEEEDVIICSSTNKNPAPERERDFCLWKKLPRVEVSPILWF